MFLTFCTLSLLMSSMKWQVITCSVCEYRRFCHTVLAIRRHWKHWIMHSERKWEKEKKNKTKFQALHFPFSRCTTICLWFYGSGRTWSPQFQKEVDSKKGHKDDQRAGKPVLWGKTEGVWPFLLGEDKTQGDLFTVFKHLKGRCKEGGDSPFTKNHTEKMRGNRCMFH